MQFSRIESAVDITRMQKAHVGIIGGGFGLAADLIRCGLGSITIVDFDQVDGSNPARQDFTSEAIGQYKVEALAETIRQINPRVNFTGLARDFCSFTPAEIDEYFGTCDLLIMAADRFFVQARGNIEAIRLGLPALFLGLYTGGRAGEIIITQPDESRACYRCIASQRYKFFGSQDPGQPISSDIPSTGATILDLHFLDSIAGQIALGLLTSGADNRFGRLIDQLGDRNLLQCRTDPTYLLGDQNVFAEHLGSGPANFSFSSIALAIAPESDCPDCARKVKHRKKSKAA